MMLACRMMHRKYPQAEGGMATCNSRDLTLRIDPVMFWLSFIRYISRIEV